MIRLKTRVLTSDSIEIGKVNIPRIIDVIEVNKRLNMKNLNNKSIGLYERRIDRYLPIPAHNMIFQVCRNNPRFIENGRIVLVKNRLGENVYFISDGVWLHPFRAFKGTEKDNVIINPTTLGNARIRFEKPVAHYLFSHYGHTSLDFFGIDFTEEIWIDYFLQTLEWDDILVNFMKHYFKKKNTRAAARATNAFEFSVVAINCLLRFRKMLPKEWKKQHFNNIRVVIGTTKNNRLLYWLEIGKYHISYSPATPSKFSARLSSTINYDRNFEMTVNEFINYLVKEKSVNVANEEEIEQLEEPIELNNDLSYIDIDDILLQDDDE